VEQGEGSPGVGELSNPGVSSRRISGLFQHRRKADQGSQGTSVGRLLVEGLSTLPVPSLLPHNSQSNQGIGAAGLSQVLGGHDLSSLHVSDLLPHYGRVCCTIG
jgi:hypothetical protein